jgi:hypothetical protein
LCTIRPQAKEPNTDSQEPCFGSGVENICQKNLVSLLGRRPRSSVRLARICEGGGYNTWRAQAVQAQRKAAAATQKKTKYPNHVNLQPSSDAVGTGIAPSPPHRSVRAELRHTALALGTNDQEPPK